MSNLCSQTHATSSCHQCDDQHIRMYELGVFAQTETRVHQKSPLPHTPDSKQNPICIPNVHCMCRMCHCYSIAAINSSSPVRAGIHHVLRHCTPWVGVRLHSGGQGVAVFVDLMEWHGKSRYGRDLLVDINDIFMDDIDGSSCVASFYDVQKHAKNHTKTMSRKIGRLV